MAYGQQEKTQLNLSCMSTKEKLITINRLLKDNKTESA